MSGLKFNNMKIQSNENSLEITMNDESILNIKAVEDPDVYMKYEIKDGQAYIYMKTKVEINCYLFKFNEAIDYKNSSQWIITEKGLKATSTAMNWSNVNNPKARKVAGFNVNNSFNKSEYDLFMILDDVTTDLKFEVVEIYDVNKNKVLYQIE